MPSTRPYTISATPERLTLNRKTRAGEVSFTVTNDTAGSIRTEIRLRALDGADTAWFSLGSGEAVREIAPGKSSQYTVRVEVPTTVKAGNFRLRLDANSVNHPEEIFAEGPVVSFEVAEAVEVVATGKPRWPLWVLLAVLAVCGAGVVVRVVSDGSDLQAGFDVSPPEGFAPLKVAFTNATTGAPRELHWIFGDGGERTWKREDGTSTPDAVVEHTYERPGDYTALLLALDGKQFTQATGQVRVLEQVDADFLATPLSGPAPLTVNFVNQSTGDAVKWKWDFGDGRSSNERDPSPEVYKAVGKFSVKLTATGPELEGAPAHVSTEAVTVEVLRPTGAAFDANPLSGERPLRVAFTDRSAGNPTSWSWDFGDGTRGTANAQKNPTHTYTKAGSYSVALKVTGPAGTDSVTKTRAIVVKEPVRTVPKVVGLSLSDAQKRITQAGLKVGEITFLPMPLVKLGDKVMTQVPLAGNQVLAGSKVNLQVIK